MKATGMMRRRRMGARMAHSFCQMGEMAVLLMGMPEVGVQKSSMRRQYLTFRSWLATGLVVFLGFSSLVQAQQRVVTPSKNSPKKATTSKATAPASTKSESKAKRTVETKTETEEGAMSVEALTERAKKSLVVISHYGRDGKVDGVGSGFVIDAKGLIATSFHVIGEARPIKVAFPDGKQRTVTEVYAWDRKMDLAILKVDAEGLTPLPLGDSDALKQGASVVALGNPQGLEYSVVQGVVSGRREFEYSEMIQLAIPLEPGNSGGPLVDACGRVIGINSFGTVSDGSDAEFFFAIANREVRNFLARNKVKFRSVDGPCLSRADLSRAEAERGNENSEKAANWVTKIAMSTPRFDAAVSCS